MADTRNTPQREIILKYLRSVKTHPSAEMVYSAVKEQMSTITLATVYRNLNLLADQGEILKLEINNEFRFDGDTKNHQHCVCKKCGKIVDVFQENLSTHVLNNIHTNEFCPERVNIIFSGLCKSCVKR